MAEKESESSGPSNGVSGRTSEPSQPFRVSREVLPKLGPNALNYPLDTSLAGTELTAEALNLALLQLEEIGDDPYKP